MTGIAFECLPAVVQDAVRVVRERPGIDYLWVDALCIVQDNKQEWKSESAAMADVYGGATFVISALSSVNVDHGFLGSRAFDPVPVGEALVTYWDWQSKLQLYIRKMPRALHREFEISRLNRRAWPFQERILAPAVLHYGRDQIIWECSHDFLLSETGAITKVAPYVIRLSGTVWAANALWNMRNLWDYLVEEYTARELTEPSDRLPALTGLISKLRSDDLYSGRHAAGLWEDDLEFQLLWIVRNPDEARAASPARVNPQHPSWSWAHRNRAVKTTPRSGSSCLTGAPRFRFARADEAAQSQAAGPTVAWAEVGLRGFVQDVGAAAVRFDSQPHKAAADRLWTYAGLPGEGSFWAFDHGAPGAGLCHCVRVVDRSPARPQAQDPDAALTSGSQISYLVVQRVGATAEPSAVNGEAAAVDGDAAAPNVFKRIGVLVLYDAPPQSFTQPYTDILFANGRPLLTNGRWEDITLR